MSCSRPLGQLILVKFELITSGLPVGPNDANPSLPLLLDLNSGVRCEFSLAIDSSLPYRLEFGGAPDFVE